MSDAMEVIENYRADALRLSDELAAREAEVAKLRKRATRRLELAVRFATTITELQADLAAERARVARVEALRDDYLARVYDAASHICAGSADCHAALHVHGCYGDLNGYCDEPSAHRTPDAEPRCPHVAEPGSRHEDEDCPCVDES